MSFVISQLTQPKGLAAVSGERCTAQAGRYIPETEARSL
jgi:hypothetical protein